MLKQLSKSSKKTLKTTSEIVSQRAINNPRSFISIINTSSSGEILYVSDGEVAKAGEGIALYPGGIYQDTIVGTGGDPIYPSQDEIHVIASANTATIAIMEKVVVRDN